MNDYVLLSDSTTDLPAGMAENMDVAIVPLSYIIDGVSYDDRWESISENGIVTHSSKEFYDLMRAGALISTSQVNEHRFMEFFQRYLKAGKDIIFLSLSSGMSGTCHQAVNVAEKLRLVYPERQITVIDSLIASMGEGLFLYQAVQKRKAGVAYDKLVSYMKAIQMRMNGWVAVGDLQYLKRSGRLNASATLFGSMLKIKPILTADRLGQLIVSKIVRGHKNAMHALVERVARRADDPTDSPIFISHSDCPEIAEELRTLLKERFGTKTIITSYIGSVLGSHIGPGTVALYFVGEER